MQTEIYILDADYVNNRVDNESNKYKRAKIRLFGITEKGKTVIAYDSNFYPYMYCLPKFDLEQTKEYVERVKEDDFGVKDVEIVEKTIPEINEKKSVLKIYGYHPSDLPKIRDFIKPMDDIDKDKIYEYSINFYKRYLIDKNIQPTEKYEITGTKIENDNYDIALEIDDIKQKETNDVFNPDILAFDIETYKNTVTMLSIKSNKLEKVLTYKNDDFDGDVELLKNEKKLIERFIELINENDPDIIITYNGDQFDFSILKNRADHYNIDLDIGRNGSSIYYEKRANESAARIPGRAHIDLYSFVDKILSTHLKTEVLSLNDVAEEIIGTGKLEYSYDQIKEDWKTNKNIAKMAKYCLNDSIITYRLAEELLPQIFELSKLTNQISFDTTRMTYGQLVEWYLLKEAYPKRISPSRPKYDQIQERRGRSHYTGGFVKEPIPGIHENIYVLDFQSLYPTIIVSYNISPDTLNIKNCNDKAKVPESDVYFCKDEEGFIPGITKRLIDERIEIKEELQELNKNESKYKHLDNRQYALKIMANSIYGYYGYVGARWYSKKCAESITALGRKWIKEVMEMAEDSDHKLIYGDTDSLMITGKNIDQFIETVNTKLPGIMKLELEGIFKKGIFTKGSKGKGAKKRYALVDDGNKLKIRGFETVRRDWCKLAKDVQREILKRILIDDSVDKSIEYAKNIIKETKNRNVELSDLIIYTELTKPIDEYKTTTPHVSAAKKMKENDFEVNPGDVIMYVITEGEGKISERAKPYQIVDIDEIDTNYYIDNQIVPAALRVLKVLNVDRNQLLGKGSQEKLGDFA